MQVYGMERKGGSVCHENDKEIKNTIGFLSMSEMMVWEIGHWALIQVNFIAAGYGDAIMVPALRYENP